MWITQKIKIFLLDIFFPKFCLGCKKEGSYLCEDCRSILDISEFNYCLCNKNPIRKLYPLGKCQKCQHKKLSGLYFALPYKEKHLTKKLIYQFKYEPYLKNLSGTLANIIIEHLFLSKNNADEIWQDSVLIPVPISKEKFKNRGYNQSEELAKELSKVLKIPVLPNILIKIKNTPSQMELSGKERENNLEGAFLIKNAEKIADQKIFLVDDVYTTGFTIEECARTLLSAGAKEVWGICLARESL